MNEAFKAHFRVHYEALVARGAESSVAAAEALREAHRVVSSQVSATQPSPSATPAAAPTPPLVAKEVLGTCGGEQQKRCSQAPPHDSRMLTGPSPRLTVEDVRELLEECRTSGSFVPTPLIRAVGAFFSDLDALMESFDPGDGVNVGMVVDGEGSVMIKVHDQSRHCKRCGGLPTGLR